MTDAPKPDPSPYLGLDYPFAGCDPHARPVRSEALGRLALDVQTLTGASGFDALSAAILIDQGRSSEALDLLTAAAADKAAEADERKRLAREKAAAR